MSLASGTQLGPYEILVPLGAGGMGEVYRARDVRLGRDVAVKVLPAELAQDVSRRSRLEQEARAASALNHPNIVTIYDIGYADGALYVAMELVHGKTLSEILDAGPLPVKKLLDVAIQIAEGLAKAHDAGIIHRDLKPQNVMVTPDGVVKILDFGLAKLTPPVPGHDSQVATFAHRTGPGVILGTVGYMSPEQVGGKPVDHRGDQFSFGVILYEMATGHSAFGRDNTVDTLSAILHDEPQSIGEINPRAPTPMRWIVERCLAKDPGDRYAATSDLCLELAGFREHLSEAVVWPTLGVRTGRVRLWLSLAVAALLAGLVAGFLAGRHGGFLAEASPERSSPSFHQLTFRRGTVVSARLAPDGETIIYGAAWDGKPMEVFSTRPESPESRSLDYRPATILSISGSGDMALALRPQYIDPSIPRGMLAQAPLVGGAPREILEDVSTASWAPDGRSLAVVREVNGRYRIEYPIGKVLYETSGWIGEMRVSPRGDRIAFLDHPVHRDNGGVVATVDRSGLRKTISERWESAAGLAWAPSGQEIWFTAAASGGNRSIHALTLEGRHRLVLQVPGRLTLHDISRTGRVLLTRDTQQVGMLGCPAGESTERDLSWHDWSLPRDLSPDGKLLLFNEAGEAGGAIGAVYLRNLDAPEPVKLGEGHASALSPDGKWALTLRRSTPTEVVILPTGAGSSKTLPRGSVVFHQSADWFPDGKKILFTGYEANRGSRLFVQGLAGTMPSPITGEGVRTLGHSISPDGTTVAAIGPDQSVALYRVADGVSTAVRGLVAGEVPIRWSADGRSLYVFRQSDLPAKVYRLDLSTGRRELWKEFLPADRTGITFIPRIQLTDDGKSYVYSYTRTLSELYLVDGLK